MMCVMLYLLLCSVFFFVKQKTAYEMRISDWSSDVCSSDLLDEVVDDEFHAGEAHAVRREAPPLEGRGGVGDVHHHMCSGLGQGAGVDLLAELGRESCGERVCKYL